MSICMRHWRRWRSGLAGSLSFLLACGLGALSACTEPRPRLRVTITPHATVASYSYPQPYLDARRCDFTVTASASGGRSGDFAEWLDITEHWSLSGTTYADTDTIIASDAAAEWGADRIYADQSLSANRYAYWSGSFELARTYHYKLVDGHVDSSTFVLECN